MGRVRASLFVSVAAIVAAPAAAQDEPGAAGADAGQSENVIVVTAARRAQDIRDVAGGIAVVTGDQLERAAATELRDFIRSVPSVQFNDTGEAQNSIISIRGVSSTTGVGTTQQTTGIYIDETPFSDVFSFLSTPDLTPFDLERVEVLKGPQGALYGSGSMGGAIRYVTAKPTFDDVIAKYNGAMSFTEDGGLNTLNQAALNLPLSDNLAIRGVISYRTDDGFVDNTLVGISNQNDLEQFHARISARWAPTDRTNIYASYIYQEAEQGGTSRFEDPTGETPETGFAPPGSTELRYEIATINAEHDFDAFTLMASASYAGKRRRTFSDSGPASVISVTGSFDPLLTQFLTPIGAYTPGDLLQADLDSLVFVTQPKSDAYFFEARLTSPSDQPVRWLLGGLYSDYDNFNPIQQLVPGLNAALSQYVIPPPFDGAFGAPDAAALFGIPANDQILDFSQASSAREFAIYGDIQIDVTDKLEVTAGGRYFDFSVDTQLNLGGAQLIGIDNDLARFQPRVTANYQFDPDAMIYAVFSKGYRVGGVNDTIAIALTPGTDPNSLNVPLTYDTDNLFNYEVGMRTAWLDSALTFDLSAYIIDWSDIQLSAFFPAPASVGGGVSVIDNVGDATIYGAELQLVYRFGERSQFSTNVSWTDAAIDSATPPVPNLETGQVVSAPAGTRLPGSRDWQIANNLMIGANVFNREATFNISHTFASATISDFVLQQKYPSYHLVGLSFDVELAPRVNVGLFADNIFDEREIIGFFQAQPAFSSPRTFAFTRPRTIGLRLAAEF